MPCPRCSLVPLTHLHLFPVQSFHVQVQIPRILKPPFSQSTLGEARRFELRFKSLPHTVLLSSLVLLSVSPTPWTLICLTLEITYHSVAHAVLKLMISLASASQTVGLQSTPFQTLTFRRE